MSTEKDFECQPLPGDKIIEVPLDRRTFILVKDPAGRNIVEICVEGSQGSRKKHDQ